jgi:16S rRNA processing protein RimM
VQAATSQYWIELGRIGSPFGVQGWVRVQSFTDPPDRLLEFPRWVLRPAQGERQERRLIEGRWQGKALVVLLAEVADRTSAEGLRGAMIEIPRTQLPPPGERQFYRVDLVGLAVRNLQGEALGSVDYFVDTPAHPVMVVRGAREHWVPATPQHLQRVDLAGGTVVVDWPLEME